MPPVRVPVVRSAVRSVIMRVMKMTIVMMMRGRMMMRSGVMMRGTVVMRGSVVMALNISSVLLNMLLNMLWHVLSRCMTMSI